MEELSGEEAGGEVDYPGFPAFRGRQKDAQRVQGTEVWQLVRCSDRPVKICI